MTASPPSIGKNSWEMVGSASLSTNSGARVRVKMTFSLAADLFYERRKA
jgi:hypothetical protein